MTRHHSVGSFTFLQELVIIIVVYHYHCRRKQWSINNHTSAYEKHYNFQCMEYVTTVELHTVLSQVHLCPQMDTGFGRESVSLRKSLSVQEYD